MRNGFVRSTVLAIVTTLTTAGSALAAFPDARDPPPAGWTGPVFKLSQAYPASLPNLEPLSKRKWRQFDFRIPAQAPQYLKAVLDYCLEGNTADNFADVSQNSVRKWYHTPWLHTTASGREFIRGMTRERPSRVGELGPAQTSEHASWAVGVCGSMANLSSARVGTDAHRRGGGHSCDERAGSGSAPYVTRRVF